MSVYGRGAAIGAGKQSAYATAVARAVWRPARSIGDGGRQPPIFVDDLYQDKLGGPERHIQGQFELLPPSQ